MNELVKPGAYGYIYLTENLVNGKKYIGQHKSNVFHDWYKGSGSLIQNAFKKYGFNNFKTEVIEWCYSKEELDAQEEYWIDFYDAQNSNEFYNIEGGGNKRDPYTHNTEEAKESFRKKRSELSSGVNNPMYGTHPTPWNKGRKCFPEEIRTGKDAPFYGHSHTEEAKQAMREKLKGKELSGEHRAAISNGKMGHEVSQSCRDKIAETLRRKSQFLYEHEDALDIALIWVYEEYPEIKKWKPLRKYNLINAICNELRKQGLVPVEKKEQRKYKNK